MAKSILKLKARKLRIFGNSIKDIAHILNVSQSSVSLWCRDVKLSQEQLKKILGAKEYLIKRGRMKGAIFQRSKRLHAIQNAAKEAKVLSNLTEKEFFIAGLALYLAEGTKTYGTVQFTNSNKRMVKFMIKWFRYFYKIHNSDMKCSIHINAVHKSREADIMTFWKKYLRFKTENFTNIRYVKILAKKKYANHNNYYGTVDLRIKKSTYLLYKLNALTERLLSIPML